MRVYPVSSRAAYNVQYKGVLGVCCRWPALGSIVVCVKWGVKGHGLQRGPVSVQFSGERAAKRTQTHTFFSHSLAYRNFYFPLTGHAGANGQWRGQPTLTGMQVIQVRQASKLSLSLSHTLVRGYMVSAQYALAAYASSR